MELRDLYNQIITENSRSTANRHSVPGATHTLEGVNASCGDDIVLELRVEDGVIADAGFTGSGCAISQASASLMIDLIQGRPAEEALRLSDIFLRMIQGQAAEEEIDELEDAAALQGISKIPARVKCAVLGWHTLTQALDTEK